MSVTTNVVDDMIKMNVDSHVDLLTYWSECPMKLPKMVYHGETTSLL